MQVLQDTPLELFASPGTGCDFGTRLSCSGEDGLHLTDRFYLRQNSPLARGAGSFGIRPRGAGGGFSPCLGGRLLAVASSGSIPASMTAVTPYEMGSQGWSASIIYPLQETHVRLRTCLTPTAIALLAVLAPSPAFADSNGTPRASSDGAHRIYGAAVSSLQNDQRRLSVEGRLGGDGEAAGRLSFTHQGPSGLAHFTARVSCLQFKDGVTEVSGTITKGENATGNVLDGKPVAFTLDTEGKQNFSLPKIGDGAAKCGGGRLDDNGDLATVPVTQAGFHVR